MKKTSLAQILFCLGFLAVMFPARALAFVFPVPEVDPSLAVGAIALLTGAVVVLRSRRSR